MLQLLEPHLQLGQLLALGVEVAAQLLELALLGEVLLAQVEELALASTAPRGGIGGGARAVELALELRDLPLELADLAQ